MKARKNLGIWMDHSEAHLMEFSHATITCNTLEQHNFSQGEAHDSSKGEYQIQNKEKQHLESYYKKLGNVIKNYDDVLLFGPTAAKIELLHHLRADHNFSNIKIEVKPADKMTENQQHAYVKEYFTK